MNSEIRYLRMSLHLPGGGQRGIGYLSQYGDILRASFDADYLADPQRPTLTLALRGATEADTQAILGAARDVRLSRSDGRWPSYFQNLLPEGHNRDRLALERRCSPDDEFELLDKRTSRAALRMAWVSASVAPRNASVRVGRCGSAM